jgi:predicted Zn-ribbon and HTH transcriptional regulator
MARITITVDGWRCERCGHEWIPLRENAPRVCPKCKSPYWDRPRRAASEPEASER